MIEQKVAGWIVRNDGYWGQRRMYCPHCNRHSGLRTPRPFCPWCGRRVEAVPDMKFNGVEPGREKT